MNIYNLNIDSTLPILHRTMVTVGMFDGVHLGHQHLLSFLTEQSRRMSLTPVVVTFDRHPREVLGDTSFKMLTTTSERLGFLEECEVEHLVLVHFTKAIAQLSATQFAENILKGMLDMSVLLLGYDNRFGNRQAGDFDQLADTCGQPGFEIIRQEEVRYNNIIPISSTRIRECLALGDTSGTAAMLGRPYSVTGTVTRGRQVGRTLGFPTANVSLPAGKMLPREGVYAATAHYGDCMFPAVANIGAQPTFGLDSCTVEVHLIDFEGDLYGQYLTIELHELLRDIHRYENAERLADRIRLDIEIARSLSALQGKTANYVARQCIGKHL